ncbi:MAG: hypothetical protein J5944_12690 [Lentisphaeria bacterium]|nr:hypothetical protein [Lentisphaeria bacterium]
MSDIRFQRLGGSFQLLVEKPSDLTFIPDLNDALWAMTSARCGAFRSDPDFLAMLDSDKNGRIRVNEVKEAVRWMTSLLTDFDGVMKGADTLRLNAVNRNNPEGREIIRTIRVALANLGVPDAQEITLAQICDQKNIIADALQNGDGIIPPDPVQDPKSRDCIRLIMKFVSSRKDLSGVEGVGTEDLDAFLSQAQAVLDWRDACEKDRGRILPYGEKTDAVYASFRKIEEKVSAFFRNCEALALSDADGAARTAPGIQVDPMDDSSVDAFLSRAPLAPVNRDRILKLDEVRHPQWREAVLAFFEGLPDNPEREINADLWKKICSTLAPYGAWISARPASRLTEVDASLLRSILDSGTPGHIRTLIRRDTDVNKNLQNCSQVRKLILFQKNMMRFLNNYVTLNELFDDETPSLIQSGRLVMDGRCFSLCMIVADPAMHKKIAEASNICVMYLDAVTGVGPTEKKIKIAAAVTSGHMRHLFVGKSGLFYSADGTLWDATIFDFIQQPVSIREALVMPFYKFADFLQKQADKFFSARSKQYEDTLAKDIQSKSALPTPTAAPAPQQPQQPPAFSGSMVLMGGGVGIAAIGSAFAFMAKSIQGISVGSVLAVFLGILLIFGGPIILISLNKLFRRNLSIFFEANGFALNGQMRLSLRMGRFFTYTPRLPGRVKVFKREIFSMESVEAQRSKDMQKYWLYILLAIFAVECVVLFCWYNRDTISHLWHQFF